MELKIIVNVKLKKHAFITQKFEYFLVKNRLELN